MTGIFSWGREPWPTRLMWKITFFKVWVAANLIFKEKNNKNTLNKKKTRSKKKQLFKDFLFLFVFQWKTWHQNYFQSTGNNRLFVKNRKRNRKLHRYFYLPTAHLTLLSKTYNNAHPKTNTRSIFLRTTQKKNYEPNPMRLLIFFKTFIFPNIPFSSPAPRIPIKVCAHTHHKKRNNRGDKEKKQMAITPP